MSTKLSTFKEFDDPEEAARAVRGICAAGIEDVVTCNLTPNLNCTDDVGSSPAKKAIVYVVIGLLSGATFGAAVGSLVFWIPAEIVNFAHADILSLVGTIICTIFGALLMMAAFFAMSKRKTVDPSGSKTTRTIGVQVRADNANQLKMAKKILAHYAPHTV